MFCYHLLNLNQGLFLPQSNFVFESVSQWKGRYIVVRTWPFLYDSAAFV